ncbi:ImmA/IrrE family metallo-endopeptidase [Microlunatus speluncae]|uniref:ImmA/IrrE family metallo-endopeptidase n=1 Tax=Microlunatus speluncae TaxID=2594267 RepID=UPI001266774F|nr:ImmA/IrrE family metallo-endopeptidase [Microlunatus speluncae]
MVREGTVRGEREAKLDALHQRLTAAVESLVTGQEWRRALEFSARFRARSFNNTLLIWSQHLAAYEQGRVPDPAPTYVAGFKQWQVLGRQVGRGQSGYVIQAPVTARFASSTPGNPASWRRLGRNEAPRPGEVLRRRMIGIKPAYVWDVSQTSGEPVPEHPSPQVLAGEAPPGLWQGLSDLVHRQGFTLLRVPSQDMIGGANGITNYALHTVTVRENMDPAAQTKTLAHELAHVMLHGPQHPDAVTHRGIAEVEAESVALMIGAAHGLDTAAYTIPYVTSWATEVEGKSPGEVIQATGERVRATAVRILDSLSTIQVSNGVPPGLDTPATKDAVVKKVPPALNGVPAPLVHPRRM